MDAQAIDEVAPLLDASDFYRPLHVDIYKHMCRLHDAGELVDTITLYHALHEGSKDQDESLLGYLIGLTNAEVFSLVGAEEYARRVSQDAKRRKLIRFGAHVVTDAHADPDADATLEKAEAGLFEIARQGRFSEWSTLSEVAVDYFDRFTLLQQQRGQVGGVPTGFRALDFYLGGLIPKDMIVVAGRPGTGKTSFGLSIAYNAAFKYGKKIAIFSLEMSKDELFGRLLSMRARVDGHRLRMPWLLDSSELERIEQAKSDLRSDCIFIDETPSINTALLRSKARRLRAKHGIDLVILDYLQLMEAHLDGKRIRERYLEVAEISKAIKSLAKELEVLLVALAQLNREVENRASKVPQLADLRDSGQIEQDCDIVMFLYSEEMHNPNTDRKGQVDVIIAKHRHGPIGEVALHFEKRYTQFSNLEVKR
jgi:replicative DNA helicase